MKKYQISSKVKVPSDARFTKSKARPKVIKQANPKESFPFSRLEKGQSFFVTGETARGMRNHIHRAKSAYNHRYVSRTTETGARVWRVQ